MKCDVYIRKDLYGNTTLTATSRSTKTTSSTTVAPSTTTVVPSTTPTVAPSTWTTVAPTAGICTSVFLLFLSFFLFLSARYDTLVMKHQPFTNTVFPGKPASALFDYLSFPKLLAKFEFSTFQQMRSDASSPSPSPHPSSSPRPSSCPRPSSSPRPSPSTRSSPRPSPSPNPAPSLYVLLFCLVGISLFFFLTFFCLPDARRASAAAPVSTFLALLRHIRPHFGSPSDLQPLTRLRAVIMEDTVMVELIGERC